MEHFDRLKESGFSEDQAKALISIHHDNKEKLEASLATKKDIELIRKDIEFLRQDTKKDIEQLRQDTKKDIEQLRQDGKKEAALLKKDLTIKVYSLTVALVGIILTAIKFWILK